MSISGFLPIFLVGCFGGLAGELLKWYRLRESPNLPEYLRSPFYWAVTIAMVLAGGILAVLYGLDNKNGILVANIGLSAPLIIQGLAASNPVQSAPGGKALPRPGETVPRASLSNFLAGR